VSSFEAISIRQSTVTEILAASRIRVRRGSQVETLACTMGRSKLKRGASSVAPVGAVPGVSSLSTKKRHSRLAAGGCGCAAAPVHADADLVESALWLAAI
jgi:hypothetical protein